jgi:two-component system, NarL family, sensor kinase
VRLRWVVLLVAVVPLALASLAVAWMVSQRSRTLAELHLAAVQPVLLAARKAELQGYVNMGRSAIAHLVRDGMPDAAAQAEALAILQRLEFGHDGSFFVFDFGGRSLVAPRRSAGLPAPTGDDHSAEFPIERILGQARAGGGYVEYEWPRPSTGRLERKLGYVEPIAGWEWALGTGSYIDEPAQARRRVEEATAGAVFDTLLRVAAIAILGLLVAAASGVLINLNEQRKADAKLRAMAHQIVATQEAERARVARELHDGVSQWLVSVKFQFEAAQERARRVVADGPLAQSLAEGLARLREVLADLRRISHDLRPAVLDDLGLARALQQLTEDWSRRSGIAVRADCGETGDVPPDVATALYRVAQEALGNIERHAAAGSVEVQLTRRGGGLELLLADDGHGFDVGHVLQAPREGLGLTHMRERVETLGGRFEIASSAQGTRLRVHFEQRALRA